MITNLQEIVKELCIRFENKPRKCNKQNDTFLGSNPRIINIHNQILCYYHPISKFEDLDLGRLSSVIPKNGIRIQFIKSLSKQKNSLSISFPKNKIVKYGKNNKESFAYPDSQRQMKWTFHFSYDIDELPIIEEKERDQKKRIKENEKKKKQQQTKRKKHLDLEEQERINLQRKNQEQFQKFLNQKQKLSEEQQYNRNEERQRKRLERQRMVDIEEKVEQQKPFEQSFNQEYYRIPKKTLNQLVEIQHNILKVVGNFRLKAIQASKFIITNLLSEKIISNYRIQGTNNEFYFQKIFIRFGGKQLNQQFLNMTHVADVISVLYRTNDQFKMRVPLACFVKYRGYKCICTCYSFEDKQVNKIVYEVKNGITVKTSSIIQQKLKSICKQLNLKPYHTDYNSKEPIYLDQNLKIYDIVNDPFKFQYITNLKQTFPIDVNLNKDIDQRTVRFRPEYVHSGSLNQPISAGAFLYSVDDQIGQSQDQQAGRASYLLQYDVLPKFVERLNNLSILLIDSASITEALQVNGINVRYIGKIAKLAYLPYIRQLMSIQAVARTIKILFRSRVKEFSQEVFRNTYRPGPYNQGELSKQALAQFQTITKSVVIDFLNLVFANTQQSKLFWQEFIKPLCKSKFDVVIKTYPFEICYGALLHAVLYHCGIKIKFDVNVKLFNAQFPFKPTDWIQYTVFSKTFEFPGFEIQQLARKSTEYIENNFTDLAIKALNLELSIQKALRSSEYSQHCALPEQRVLIKLSNLIQVKTSDFPMNHPSMLQYILNNVSDDNFVKANNIAEFSLPSTHPLFITFYMSFSKIYDKKMLFRSSVIVALRSLGSQHEETCKLLSTTDKQDIDVLKKAWVDNGQNNHQIILIVTKRLEQIGKLVQCVQYCEKGIKRLDPPRQKTFKALVIICMRAIKNCYQVRNVTYMNQCINILWKTLQQFDSKNQVIYYDMIKYTLKIKLEKHPLKEYIYKLILIVVQKILKDRYYDEIKKAQKPLATLDEIRALGDYEYDSQGKAHANLLMMVGEEERSVILQQIIKTSRQAKSHVHWIINTLTQVSVGYNSINFNNTFFINFEKLSNQLNNQDFDEGMQSLELLVKLYGQQLFLKALIQDIFCQDV